MIFRFVLTQNGDDYTVISKTTDNGDVTRYTINKLFEPGFPANRLPKGFHEFVVEENVTETLEKMVLEFGDPYMRIECCDIYLSHLKQFGGYVTWEYDYYRWSPFEFADIVYELACL